MSLGILDPFIDKLGELVSVRRGTRNAIINQDVAVPNTLPWEDYPSRIALIETGDTATEEFFLTGIAIFLDAEPWIIIGGSVLDINSLIITGSYTKEVLP